MQRQIGFAHKGRQEFFRQLRIKRPHFFCGDLQTVCQMCPPGQIHRAQDQCFVHREDLACVAEDPCAVAQRLRKRHPQTNPDILHRMMVVHLRIPVTDYIQIKPSVFGKQRQHMVQKSTTGIHPAPARPIQA